jgi:hypothetical protein
VSGYIEELPSPIGIKPTSTPEPSDTELAPPIVCDGCGTELSYEGQVHEGADYGPMPANPPSLCGHGIRAAMADEGEKS